MNGRQQRKSVYQLYIFTLSIWVFIDPNYPKKKKFNNINGWHFRIDMIPYDQ